jgi:hypothetical protein
VYMCSEREREREGVLESSAEGAVLGSQRGDGEN